MDVTLRRLGCVMLAAALTFAACAVPGPPAPPAACARTIATATATYPPPVYHPPPTLDPSLPTSTPMPPPSPEPSPPPPPPPTATPTVTATLMPLPPGQITPWPTSPPFTPSPRPRLPKLRDITVGSDGCYTALVDGLRWSETTRTIDPATGEEFVVMWTPSLCEAVRFWPDSSRVEYLAAARARVSAPASNPQHPASNIRPPAPPLTSHLPPPPPPPPPPRSRSASPDR